MAFEIQRLPQFPDEDFELQLPCSIERGKWYFLTLKEVKFPFDTKTIAGMFFGNYLQFYKASELPGNRNPPCKVIVAKVVLNDEILENILSVREY